MSDTAEKLPLDQTIYKLAREGYSQYEIAEMISKDSDMTEDNILLAIQSDGQDAIAYHVGVLAKLEAPEYLLYNAAMGGDVEAIGILLELNRQREIDQMVDDMF